VGISSQSAKSNDIPCTRRRSHFRFDTTLIFACFAFWKKSRGEISEKDEGMKNWSIVYNDADFEYGFCFGCQWRR
jgi:hypothetical protein